MDFISAQVTWQNLERPTAHLIMIVDRHLRGGEGRYVAQSHSLVNHFKMI